MKNLLILFFSTLVLLNTNAQIAFTNSNTSVLTASNYSGLCMAVVDMNGDKLDDIVQLNQGKNLVIQYQRAGNTFTSLTVGAVSTESQWGMTIGDFDNNGFNDIVCGGSYDGMKVYLANNTGTSYTQQLLQGASIFTQNVNIHDVNNDGYLDVWSCHDDGPAPTWLYNSATRNFSVNYTYINTNLPNGSDNSGNYGSIFTDYDNDGDMDLYVAKCRQGVNVSTDPRRINILFRNNGNGTYTESATAANLAIGEQSWTASFEDIDNDGDMDLFLTNHSNKSQMLENNGSGVFTDITTATGINYTDYAMQGIMRDFDNDGYVDVLVCSGNGTGHKLWKNNGNKTFTQVTTVFDNKVMESFAIGDINHDGFLDVYAGYGQVYTTPSSVADIVWLNNTNANKWLAINLNGSVSNKNGIGSRITIYYNGGSKQIREVRSGESYGTCNTFTAHFGLGTFSGAVDSVVVRWPSGRVTHTNNINSNQFITIDEVTCAVDNSVSASGPLTICPTQSVTLSSQQTGATYLWNTGATTQNVTVNTSGNYYVDISSGGCTARSQSFNVVVDPVQNPVIDVAGTLEICEANTIELMYIPKTGVTNFQWSTGETTPTINVTQGGTYTITVQGLCRTFTSPSVTVTQLSPNSPTADNVTIQTGTSTTLNATGTNVSWFANQTGGTALASNTNSYTTPVLNANASYWMESTNTIQGVQATGGKVYDPAAILSGNQYNGTVEFTATNSFTLKSVTVNAPQTGLRIIELRNTAGTVLQTFNANITTTGRQDLLLNFVITPGSYILTTNDAQNNTLFGSVSPRFTRNNSGVTYPYTTADYFSITGSNQGSAYYYYFYDWKIETPSRTCISQRSRVDVTVGNLLGVEENIVQGLVAVSPNPSDGRIKIELNATSNEIVNMVVSTIDGKQITSERVNVQNGLNTIYRDYTRLSKGVYVMSIQTSDKKQSVKFVIE